MASRLASRRTTTPPHCPPSSSRGLVRPLVPPPSSPNRGRECNGNQMGLEGTKGGGVVGGGGVLGSLKELLPPTPPPRATLDLPGLLSATRLFSGAVL